MCVWDAVPVEVCRPLPSLLPMHRVVSLVRGTCAPDVVVLQCGADTLVGDPMDSFSLSAQAVGECVQEVLGWDLPTLILGGGGSHAFTSLTGH